MQLEPQIPASTFNRHLITRNEYTNRNIDLIFAQKKKTVIDSRAGLNRFDISYTSPISAAITATWSKLNLIAEEGEKPGGEGGEREKWGSANSALSKTPKPQFIKLPGELKKKKIISVIKFRNKTIGATNYDTDTFDSQRGSGRILKEPSRRTIATQLRSGLAKPFSWEEKTRPASLSNYLNGRHISKKK